MSNEPKREKNWWEYYPLHKIWCNDYCPLVPRFWYRKKDEWNPTNFGVQWLIFNIWTMSHVSLGVDIEMSLERICVGLSLPYFRCLIGVTNLPFWNISDNYFHRKGTNDD